MNRPQTPRSPASSVILIVDDDEGLTLLMSEALSEAGFETAVASSGKAALAWLHQSRPSLVLLDLKLADITGRDLLARMESERISAPFVVITGQEDTRVAVEMMKGGALDYLVKDSSMIELLPVVVQRAMAKMEADRALAEARAALSESQKQILAISEREQRRIGADLHDNLGQQLTAIELLCQSLREDLKQHQPDLDKQIARVCQYLRQAVAQTRLLARGLSPVELDSEGLADALADLVRRTNEIGRLHCRFQLLAPVVIDDNAVAGHLFRIAQEALNNAMKHSQADEISISLSQTGETTRLEVADNGRGLPKAARAGAGIGLQVMRHRANVIRAALTVESAPGKGVKVICALRANT
jgi:signal transduction histidine kinase